MNRRLHRLSALLAFCIGLFQYVQPARGQCPTPTTPTNEVGGFALDRYKVCIGQAVNVTSTASGLLNPTYNFDYDNKPITTGFPITSTFTYTKPGTYTVLQASSGPKLFCRTVDVVSNTAPIEFTAQGCTGAASVTYTVTGDAAKYDRIYVIWGDGGRDDFALNKAGGVLPPHTYSAQNRTYPIQVYGGYTGLNCTGPVKSVPVFVGGAAGGSVPVIKSLTSSDTQIELTYQDPQGAAGSTLELLRKDPNGNVTSAGSLTSVVGAITVAAPASEITCFQLVARDGCGGAERRSSEVCSLKLSAQSANKEVNLTWAYTVPTTATIRRHQIRRSNTPVFTGSYGAKSYADKDNIECGKQYCYRQVLEIQNANTTSNTEITSASVCVTGTDANVIAGPASAFVSVLSGGGVDVTASHTIVAPATYTLIVARADSPNGPFATIAAVDNDRKYTDATAQINNQSYCYQTALLNQCGNRSDFTKPACTVFLKTGADGKTLQWTGDTPFSPANPPVTYTIIPVDAATGQTLPPINPPANATDYRIGADNQSTRFYVAAYDKDGVLVSYSNTADILLAPNLYVPTAFSPNGDGDNNEFMPKGLFWETFEMTLFDRWGAAIYNTTNKDGRGWDGTISGTPAPPGYYTYRVRITDTSGKAFERTGRVLLLR